MAWLKNNYQFEFTDTLTTSWMSVRISNEKENGAVAVFTNQYITVRSEDNSIVERMKGSATGGTLTLTMRGLDQSDTDTQDVGLKKERREWSKAFVTYVASQHVDPRDDNTFSGTQTFNNVVVSQDVTIWDDLTVAWDTTLNGKYKWPVVDDITARNALYPTPVDGNIVQVRSLNSIQFYQTSLWWRQTLWVGTPPADATDVIKGIQRNATNAEALAGTLTNATMTPDDTKYVLDRYNFTESLTAWEAMLAWEWYRRGNTALNVTVIHSNTWTISGWWTPNIGFNSSQTKQGQLYTTVTGTFLQTISVNLYKTGTPTGNISIILRNSASWSWTVIATSDNTIAESTLSTSSASPTTCVFNFNDNIAPWTYYFEVLVDRANSAVNYSSISFTSTTGTATFQSYTISDTGVWSTQTSKNIFTATLLENNEVNTKYYKALNTTNRSTIMWLVKSNVVADATLTGIKKWYIKWFTWLTSWLPVFLQADGTITHTITNKKVWDAVATDTIYIDIPRHTETVVITRDLSLATGVVTYNHTMWEKPLSVIANYSFARSAIMTYSSGMGTYNWSTQLSNCAIWNSGILSTANMITVWDTLTTYQTWFIQNITNTTFDINWTKVSTPTGTATIFLTLSL